MKKPKNSHEETWAAVRLLALAVAPPANSSRRQVVHLQVQVVHIGPQITASDSDIQEMKRQKGPSPVLRLAQRAP